jgi:N-acetylneuraminic acid mutarotase
MRALNDVYQLDISDPLHLTWKKLEPEGDLPVARGYHTSNLVGNQWIVYGGSDGADCFNDIHILDLESLRWVEVNVPSPQARLSHTATLVGPFFFVVGGRDEKEYTNHLLILNLATMKWEQRKTCGAKLSPRGYHTTILHDSRLYVFGGYDGKKYFNHVYILDLSASAYLPRMNNFELRTVPMAQSHTI